MRGYNPKEIEPKWQQHWRQEKLFATREGGQPKMYVLDMFPYPSGDGLHVGHVKIYTASDVVSRYLRMKGFDVLHPMGWDAFGLPAENTAIAKQIQPTELTRRNIERFREQMTMMGFSYDWEREVTTTDPAYYRWTQWIFLRLFDMGLAYQDTVPINWCPKDKTGLANEEVVDGLCERCGTAVEMRPMRQWLLRITKYADRLLQGLDGLDWPSFILDIQRNWIGRSEGAEVDFAVRGQDSLLKVYTTRPDTLFGATFMVVSPEHPLLHDLLDRGVLENVADVTQYCKEARRKTEQERLKQEDERTGVLLKGVVAVNPINGKEIPVWVADYVLMSYGTGAIMSVPAHDERDFDFAQRYGLPVVQVVQPTLAMGETELPYGGDGVLINSDDYSGQTTEEAAQAIVRSLQLKGLARPKTNYLLRDWVFSRQRYWGEPIPIIHCEQCGAVPVPEDELPVELPVVERYEPTGDGQSPLAAMTEWVNVKCPTCAGMGKRETDTMPQWAGSSWYWLRYLDPQNATALASENIMARWLPVDLYVGGAEHAVLHLLYARFWSYVLSDAGVVPKEEPFKRFRSVGLVLGEDGQKMSKSRGNVVTPDEVVERYGADAVRVYAMFMGPFGNVIPWSETSLNGAARFLQRVWQVVEKLAGQTDGAQEPSSLTLKVQQTIRRVSEGTEQFRFNTAVAALMELLNELERSVSSEKPQGGVAAATLETFVLLLAPYAPHQAEELWSRLGHGQSLAFQPWPSLDKQLLDRALRVVPVQVNGKVRGELTVSPGTSEEQATLAARRLDNVARYLGQGSIIKVVYVEGRMINFVVQ